MGDGIVNKFAIIINGSPDERHQWNVERSVTVLESQGYETFVASAEQPEQADHYVTPTRENIRRQIAQIKRRIDNNDELLIYVTGHGSIGGLCFDEDCNTEDLLHSLDIDRYGQRVVVMAQSLGGNWGDIFLNDPRTKFISGGSAGEIASSQFSPLFWASNVPDLNGDGQISWEERFSYAVSRQLKEGTYAFPRLFTSEGASLEPIGDVFVANFVNNPALTPEQRIYLVLTLLSDTEADVRHGALNTLYEIIGYGNNYSQIEGIDAAQVVAAVTSLITDENWYIRGEALNTYMSISERFNVPLSERAALLRSHFNDNDRWLSSAAVTAYESLADRLDPSDVLEGIRALRRFIVSRREETQTYITLVGKLDADAALEEARTLLEVLDDPYRHSHPYDSTLPEFWCRDAYDALVERLGPPQRAQLLRLLYGSEDRYFGDRDRLFGLYVDLLGHLSPGELSEETRVIESMLNGGNESDPRHAIAAYEAIAGTGALDSAGLLQGMEALRSLFKNQIWNVAWDAVVAYAGLLQRLDPSAVLQEARALRTFFNVEDWQIRTRILETYESIIDKIDAAEALEADRALRPLLNDGTVFQIYGELVSKLDPAGILERADALKSLFETGYSSVGTGAIAAYVGIIDRLDSAEVQAGAAKLRSVFDDDNPQVARNAIAAYVSIIDKLDPAEVQAGVAKVMSLFDSDDSQVGVDAISAFMSIIDRVNPADVLAAARTLKEIFTDDDYGDGVRRVAVDTYTKLLPALDYSAVLVDEEELRSLLTDEDVYEADDTFHYNTESRTYGFAYGAYRAIIERLGPATALVAAQEFRDEFDSEGSYGSWSYWYSGIKYSRYGDRSASLYRALAQKLDPAGAAEEARELRSLFEDGFSAIVANAISAYMVLAEKLDAAELAEGAAMLNQMPSIIVPDEDYEGSFDRGVLDQARESCAQLKNRLTNMM